MQSANNIRHASPNVFAVIRTSFTENNLLKKHHGVTVTWTRTVRVTASPPLLSPVRA